jgi:hypothetical protein
MGGGGMGESISSQTVIENGRQKTITKKTTIDRNGNQKTEIVEEFQDPKTGRMIQNQYVDNGLNGSQMKSIGGGKKKSSKR